LSGGGAGSTSDERQSEEKLVHGLPDVEGCC
jgi:hypothetical protein